ncbi:MAG: 1-acyl-sn-glycerol-3-phosphate acyltransferase [Clostridiales bacterium]|nr:1-acyl-sn-glycerol-3-phosphate acyltransferase [Clostridiales bacterium]
MANELTVKESGKPAKKEYDYDIGCVPSNWWYHCVGENILVSLIALITNIKVKPDPDYLKEEGPIIVISNHQSYLDPMVTSLLTRGRPGNFVTGEFVFRRNPWGHWFRLGGAIPKKQFVVDTVSVKAMMKVMKRKGVLFIYPEATRSVDGSTVTFDDGVAKMAKKAGAAIYIAHIHGAYLTMPRWGKGIRRGKITAEFVKKLPGEEVKKMSAEELHQYILDGINYNENDYCRNEHPVHKGSALACGLQNVAYACPRCGSEFTMQWMGRRDADKIKCSKCGNTVRYLPSGLLEGATSEDKSFEDLSQWTSWEREQVQAQVERDDFRMELDAELFKVFDPLTFAKTGKGKVTITPTEIIYEGTDCDSQLGIPYKNGKPVRKYGKRTLEGVSKPTRQVFEIATMRGLVARYGKCFEIYSSEGELFRFYVDGQKVFKIQQVVKLLGKN